MESEGLSGSSIKNVKILVVSITGWGVDPGRSNVSFQPFPGLPTGHSPFAQETGSLPPG